MPTLEELEVKYFSSSSIYHANTEVEPLIDGVAYFNAVAEAIDACQNENDQIYITSFSFNAYMDLLGRDSKNPAYLPLGEILAAKAFVGVDVRVIIFANAYGRGLDKLAWQEWLNIPQDVIVGVYQAKGGLVPVIKGNIQAAEYLRNWVPKGAPSGTPPPLMDKVLLDWSGLADSSHHQKLVIVAAAGNVQAFVGGIDFQPNRWDQGPLNSEVDFDNTSRTGWHDAAVQIRGAAVKGVWDNFSTRWLECETLSNRLYRGSNGSTTFNPSITTKPMIRPTIDDVPSSNLSVQVLRSFGPTKEVVIKDLFERFPGDVDRKPWLSLPSGGVQEVFNTFVTAINSAQTYIYMEDQYFSDQPTLPGNRELAQAFSLFPYMEAAAARGVKVIWLVSGRLDPADGDHRPVNRTLNSDIQTRLVALLGAASKNFVLYRMDYLTVHSKLLLIDDQFASIGSANFMSRSMAGIDTELTVAMVATDTFVRDLRVRLWAEHLRTDLSNSGLQPALEDLTQALGIWRPEWGTGDSGMWRTSGDPPGFYPTETVLQMVGPM